MKVLLKFWLILVASLRILSVVFGYIKPQMLEDGVFSIAKDQVTPLAARTFGIWTLLSCTVTVMCACYIETKPLYLTTMASFVIALLYFSCEVYIFHTVNLRSALAPGIIASISLVLLTLGYPSITKEEGFAKKADKRK